MPEYIGVGLGKVMWDQAIYLAKKTSAKYFMLWADPEAEGFYKRCGCIRVGEKFSEFMSNCRAGAVMRFELTYS